MARFSVHDLSFGYTAQTLVLKELSLQLSPGQLLVLLGGNGAGKTTLLRIMAAQLPAAVGNVLIDDQDVRHWSRQQLARQLTLMPQFEGTESGLKVGEMVLLGRSAHRGWCVPFSEEDHQAADQAMKLAGLSELADRPIATLSGGQWRRTLLARSLTQEASILLLDEPTSGLDLKHQFESLRQIRSLVKERGLIAVVTLHDLNLAAAFADQIALLSGQQLLACGAPAEVLTKDLIVEAFEIDVVVTEHPIHGTPLVVPTGEVPR